VAGPLVDFFCVAVAHRPGQPGEPGGTITVFEGRWAYCDFGAKIGHHWIATGGLPLNRVRHRMARSKPAERLAAS
jgi:hypothetical protein